MKPQRQIIIKITLSISATLAIAYLGISAFVGHKLSTPRRSFDSQQASVFAIAPEEVKLRTSDDLEITGWFIPSKSSDKVLVLVHGLHSSRTAEFGGKFTEFGSAMQKQGFSILMIDLRGHGKSADSRVTFGIKERRDVIAGVNWLKQKGFKPNKIGVLGVSMGSASVIGAAAESSDLAAIAIDSGYAEVYPLFQKLWQFDSKLPDIFLPSTLMFGHLWTGYDLTTSKPVIDLAKISPRPVLIIHSTLDPYTTIENARQMKAAYPSAEYWETDAKQHAGNYNANSKMYIDKVTDFYNRSLK